VRRYGEDIEVRPGLVAGDEGPAQFFWRGRVWLVRSLLSSWITSRPWWRSAEAARVLGSEGDWAGRVGSVGGAGALVGGERDHGDVVDNDRSDVVATGSMEELQVWRVEAGRGGGYRTGVFDISRSTVTGQWRLETCLD
jgi:Domain of unknown function (DUF6504)